MNKVYEANILKVLTEVGDAGISLQKLAMNVYNMSCTLFEVPELADVVRQVRQYIRNNSQSAQSLVESTGRRGHYRLNTGHSQYARQLVLEFKDADTVPAEENEAPVEVRDLSLDLFA